MPHRNAPLTETGRLRLARCIVNDGWPLRRAAERFQVSVTCAHRWASRYRELGEGGMVDRPSRPVHSPRRLPQRRERRIINLRVTRRWGPARIAAHLRMAASTVYAVLRRYQLARLAHLDRATGRVIRRYERERPGELVHVDIKKLGNIPDGGGHKVHGRAAGSRNTTRSAPTPTTAPAPGPSSATATCTTPWMTTPGWPTPKSCPTSAKTPPPRSGPAPQPGSPPRASPASSES